MRSLAVVVALSMTLACVSPVPRSLPALVGSTPIDIEVSLLVEIPTGGRSWRVGANFCEQSLVFDLARKAFAGVRIIHSRDEAFSGGTSTLAVARCRARPEFPSSIVTETQLTLISRSGAELLTRQTTDRSANWFGTPTEYQNSAVRALSTLFGSVMSDPSVRAYAARVSAGRPFTSRSDGFAEGTHAARQVLHAEDEADRVSTGTFFDSESLGRYHALVIGNNAYSHLPELRSAKRDAAEVEQVLRQNYRYTTQLLLDATRTDILLALNELRTSLGPRDNLLIYYAGHGWLDREAGEGYWLPVDASRSDPTNWLSNASLAASLRAIRAKHVLVVADSCFSGTLSRGIAVSDPRESSLRRLASMRMRSVMAAGGLEPVFDGGGLNGHSVFASALLSVLRSNDGALTGTDLFTRVRRQVMLNSEQVPEYSDIRRTGHEGGDFIFVRRDD